MTDEVIPAEVQQFIVKRIDNIAQLETLLIMAGHARESWTVPSLVRRLYISEADTVAVLAHLRAQGLIVAEEGSPPKFRFQPESDDLMGLVSQTAAIYARHLVPVTNLIHSKMTTRIRQFADAFKLRKEKDE
ncbi:MAG TPA: hypothetical protein VJS69_08125 [Candidatus Krumholzibacteria bacterium]|nr:hypothetical protein [Candidatus Krumholzibacteria bacterium]